MYKGRGDGKKEGKKGIQHMGLAFAPSVDGPYTRNASGTTPPDLPGEDPWVCSQGLPCCDFLSNLHC